MLSLYSGLALLLLRDAYESISKCMHKKAPLLEYSLLHSISQGRKIGAVTIRKEGKGKSSEFYRGSVFREVE